MGYAQYNIDSLEQRRNNIREENKKAIERLHNTEVNINDIKCIVRGNNLITKVDDDEVVVYRGLNFLSDSIYDTWSLAKAVENDLYMNGEELNLEKDEEEIENNC